MNLIKRNWQKFILVSFTLFSPVISFAQGNVPAPCSTSGKICDPITQTSLTGFIHDLLIGILKIGTPVVALAIIYCGFLFVSARGNPEEIKHAKESLLYTIIGAAILLGSWALATLISNTVLAL